MRFEKVSTNILFSKCLINGVINMYNIITYSAQNKLK